MNRRTERLVGAAPYLAVAGLFCVCVLRGGAELLHAGPLNDELAYAAAAQRVEVGKSPYGGTGYLYPPLLAHLLGLLDAVVGDRATWILLRLANHGSLALLAWVSSGLLPFSSIWRRWLAAALFLAAAPAVGFALFTANVSPLVATLAVLALFTWRQSPLAGGAALGLSIALKPIAGPAVPLLALQRIAPRAPAWWAASTAALVTTASIVAIDHGAAFLRAFGTVTLPIGRSASLHRLLSLSGLPEAVPVLSLGVLTVAAVVVARVPLRRSDLAAVLLAASVMATPVVWSHTLLVTLPLQARAWAVARRLGRSRQALALLSILALQLAEGVTGIDHLPAASQVVAVLPIALAPAVLAWLVVTESPLRTRSEPSLALEG